MTDARRLLLALSTAAVAGGMLAGCPIPQPLPGVGNIDGGVTPPRILADGVHPGATFIPYDDAPGSCDGGARFVLQATVVDQTPDDQVEGRWFIDYSTSGAPRYAYYAPFSFTVELPDVTSTSASFPFAPAAEGWPGLPAHVVELVVSNGFDNANLDGGLPNRAPRPGYETTLYRWVFQPVPGSAACGP
jgi:hypothetical protein